MRQGDDCLNNRGIRAHVINDANETIAAGRKGIDQLPIACVVNQHGAIGTVREPEVAAFDRGRGNAVSHLVESLGVPYRWITSYVAGDQIYCVHESDDEDAVREHARRGGFPANSLNVIANEFGPHTAGSQ